MALIFGNGLSDIPPTHQLAEGNSKKEIGRGCANYHPTVWGDRFAVMAPAEMDVDELTKQRAEKLKQDVKKMLHDHVSGSIQELKFINEIQRLGVAYHFEAEIRSSLNKIYNAKNDDDDLHAVALRFRLLRQEGYNVPSDVFEKFKDEQGKFKVSLRNNVLGLLSFYEAAYLGTHDESILDEAIDFTTNQLNSLLPHLSSPLSELVKLALDMPLNKRIERLQSRYFISIYQQDRDRNDVLLEFSKLDFNILQSLHKMELSELSRWWKENEFARKLPFIRDRLVECYYWILGIYYEPHYSRARRIMTTMTCCISIMDDIYDVYGKLDELELYTTALERWDWAAMDELPDYMKVHFSALLTAVENFEKELSMEGKSHRIPYLKKAFKEVAKAYLEEARWASIGYIPRFEEYMKIALVSSSYPMQCTICLVGMGEIVTNEALQWTLNIPDVIKVVGDLSRLKNDLVSNEREQGRPGHVASGVQCYMIEFGTTYEETWKIILEKCADYWKRFNKHLLEPILVPREVMKRFLNLARVIEFMYTYKDMYTDSANETKECIRMLLVEPLDV